MAVVCARLFLVLAYDAERFWVERDNRIASALADGLERKRKKGSEGIS